MVRHTPRALVFLCLKFSGACATFLDEFNRPRSLFLLHLMGAIFRLRQALSIKVQRSLQLSSVARLALTRSGVVH